MDGESSYESDISESWSLIDINLNEESVSAAEVQSLLKTCPSDVENVKLKKKECLDIEPTDSDEIKTAYCILNDSKYGVYPLEGENGSSEEERCEDEGKKDIDDDESKNDSGDAESIEILDIEENYRESDIKKLYILFENDSNQGTYHSDEESFYEKNIDDDLNRSCSTVIKRKRRKLSRSLDSSKESVNSDSMSSSEKYSSVHPGKTKKSKSDLEINSCGLNCQPVYKHYRNNVANTVLSVSMGVIFAGVAFIAIGHFLGVHDAGETAVELMETVKKLQMKNVVLQSRLNHLNRAFTTLDTSSKHEATPHNFRRNHHIDIPTDFPTGKGGKKGTLSVQSEIYAASNPMEWVSKLQNLVQTKSNCLNNENGIDFSKVVNNIHDQLAFLSDQKTEAAKLKYLEGSDSKISKVLQKIIDKLSSSQENIEVLYERLVKLKNKLNKKLSKVFPEPNYCEAGEKFQKQAERRLPVTETDLLSIQWEPKKEAVVEPRNVDVFFPQPEEYYKMIEIKSSNQTKQSESISNEDSKKVRTLDDTQHFKKSKNIKSNDRVFEKNNKEEKFHGKNKPEKMIKKTKEAKKEKKIDELKKGKLFVDKKIKRSKKSLEDFKKKQDKIWEIKKKTQKFLLKNREGFNETKPQRKIEDKMEKLKKDFKVKRNLVKKKTKKTKVKRVFMSTFIQKPEFRRRKNNKNTLKCSKMTGDHKFRNFDPGCFNLTGHWIFKWADGRQESRRYQNLGDWQFDRAKGRKESRGEDFSLNWQFKRALARENNRNDDRFRDYNRKELFHEDFSWL